MKYSLFPRALLALAVLLGSAACQTGSSELPAEGPGFVKAVTLPQGIAVAKVKAVVVECMTGRGWTVASQSPKVIVGRLVHRGLDATVTAKITPTTVDLFSEIYELDVQGQKKGRVANDRWINILAQDMTAKLLVAGSAQ